MNIIVYSDLSALQYVKEFHLLDPVTRMACLKACPSSSLPTIFQQTASLPRHFPSRSEPLLPMDCCSEGWLVAKNRRRTWKEGGRGVSFVSDTSRHKCLTASMYSGQVIPTDVLPDGVLLGVFDFYVVRKQDTKREIDVWQSRVHVCFWITTSPESAVGRYLGTAIVYVESTSRYLGGLQFEEGLDSDAGSISDVDRYHATMKRPRSFLGPLPSSVDLPHVC